MFKQNRRCLVCHLAKTRVLVRTLVRRSRCENTLKLLQNVTFQTKKLEHREQIPAEYLHVCVVNVSIWSFWHVARCSWHLNDFKSSISRIAFCLLSPVDLTRFCTFCEVLLCFHSNPSEASAHQVVSSPCFCHLSLHCCSMYSRQKWISGTEENWSAFAVYLAEMAALQWQSGGGVRPL